MPDFSEDEINERNKSDNMARAIAIVQTLWFTIQPLDRVGQGLFLTTLELTTLAFIFLMTACSICWWRKPMDISRPVLVVQACQSLDELLDKHMPTTEFPPRPIPNLGRTPLTFLTSREWFLSQFWAYYSQILRNLWPFQHKNVEPTESERFASIDFQETDLKWELMGGPLITLYSCIFMAAWNFPFPSGTEKSLWRAASIINLVYSGVGSALAWI